MSPRCTCSLPFPSSGLGFRWLSRYHRSCVQVTCILLPTAPKCKRRDADSLDVLKRAGDVHPFSEKARACEKAHGTYRFSHSLGVLVVHWGSWNTYPAVKGNCCIHCFLCNATSVHSSVTRARFLACLAPMLECKPHSTWDLVLPCPGPAASTGPGAEGLVKATVEGIVRW